MVAMGFAGMDTGSYPGKIVMDVAWATSNLYWSGLYLDSPAPVPGEAPLTKPINGHNRLGGIGSHPEGGWMHAWAELRPNWGLLPIYWGQQDPSNEQGPVDLRDFVAVANAEDAAVKAANAGIPPGAVIYLDWEIGGTPSKAGLAYCNTWFRRLAELGYRPGVYCHPPSSLALRLKCPHLMVWSVNLLPPGTPDFSIEEGQLVLAKPAIDAPGGESPDRDAIARQWKFDVASPGGGPVPGMPVIDADVAVVQHPAFPERRNHPAEVRGGPVAAAAGAPDPVAVYAVRRGSVVRLTWSPGAPVLDLDLDGTASPAQLNPFATTSAVREPNGTEWLAALGWTDADGDGVWHVHTFRRVPGFAWQDVQAPEAGITVEALTGVVLALRSGGSPEVFVLDASTDAVAGARWDDQLQGWTSLATLVGPAGPAAPFPFRANGLATLSRAPGLLDLFFVGSDSLVRTTFSSAPGAWAGAFTIGSPDVRVQGMANLAVVSPSEDRIELVFVGRRDSEPRNRLWAIEWTSTHGWGTSVAIGGDVVQVDPLSRIAAVSRSSDFVDVFVADTSGQLHDTFLSTGTGIWTPLRPVGGGAARVADVVAATHVGQDDVGVVVTGRDGSVWATRWNVGLSDFLPLERLTPLDLQ
jgi:hypothetical protein